MSIISLYISKCLVDSKLLSVIRKKAFVRSFYCLSCLSKGIVVRDLTHVPLQPQYVVEFAVQMCLCFLVLPEHCGLLVS